MNDPWPVHVQRIDIPSTLDGTLQPSLHYSPPSSNKSDTPAHCRPLLIALHTWSVDYSHGSNNNNNNNKRIRSSSCEQVLFAEWCIRHEWHFLYPNFRGPNHHPDACGSDLAVQDVLDAVDYVSSLSSSTTTADVATTAVGAVDRDRIYVVGVSGGGHMALLLAGRHPQRWAGVSAWCAIADIATWWRERHEASLPNNKIDDDEHGNELSLSLQQQQHRHKAWTKYARMIELVLDGQTPVECPTSCAARSPVTYLAAAGDGGGVPGGVNLDIHAGIDDGRTGSVPISHSLIAFNAVVPASERLRPEFISEFYRTQQVPTTTTTNFTPEQQGEFLVAGAARNDNTEMQQRQHQQQTRRIHFRRHYKNTRVTIFQGGHEILHVQALNWLSQQRRNQSAVWDIPHDQMDWFHVKNGQSQSGI